MYNCSCGNFCQTFRKWQIGRRGLRGGGWQPLCRQFQTRRNNSTHLSAGRMGWMLHRKWQGTKQLPSMLPGPAVPGCCLISFHFLWAIHPIRPVLVPGKWLPGSHAYFSSPLSPLIYSAIALLFIVIFGQEVRDVFVNIFLMIFVMFFKVHWIATQLWLWWQTTL